jgi:putative endopeptidase
MKNQLILALLSISLLFASCGSEKTTDAVEAPDFMAANIDTTFKPGDDFFLYANNGWFKNNPIPGSEQSNGLWQLIIDTVNAQVKQICESSAAIANPEKGSNKQKIGDMYFSGMDSVTINKNGIAGLEKELKIIDEIKDVAGLANAVAMVHMVSGAPLFNFYIGQDDKISDKHAIFISQGGLSLPERSFYFDTDERAKMIRDQFALHLNNMFVLMNYDAAKAKDAAAKVYSIETAIAKASRKLEDTRDPLKNYNKFAFADFAKSSNGFDWTIFMKETGIVNPDTLIVGQPEVIKEVYNLLRQRPIDDWKNYLKYHLVRGLAPYLDDKTYSEVFNFYNATIRGVKEQKPRWKRVTQQTNSSLGELIGQVYVSEYLPKGTKEKLTEIGNNIKAVYAERIQNLDWMSDVTKQKALNKLSTIVMKVGYPDKWKDMSTLQTDRASYVRNVMNANVWSMKYMTAKFGKPVDRTEWDMYPQTYNAYYNPSNNEIVVPGANIIVPGYERKLADDAILYSIIGGSTFGHEITHGFDDQGSKYDEKGNLNSWWTAEDSVKFYNKTRLVVDQFSSYVVVDSLRINGEFTQGENIADIGGIMMGYEAFKKTKQFKENQTVAGINPNQRFFLGYALAWMINDRPESMAAQVKSDVHSPAKYRVLGPLSNMPEFYAAFDVKEGDKMWRPDSLRVKIW